MNFGSTPRSSSPSVAVRLLPATERTAVSSMWRNLEARTDTDGLACGWDWTETWLEHYGDLVPHWFAIGERAGAPIGMALITQGVGQRRGPFPIRTLHVGTAGEPADESVYVEYNRVLVAPAERDGFVRGLVQALQGSKLTWDEFLLDGFAPKDAEPFLRHVGEFVARREVCPAVDLDAIRETGGDVVAALRKGTRYNIRRSLRGFGPVETEWAETPEHAADILDELIVLHQQRWTEVGLAGVFGSARCAGFHRSVIPRLLANGAAILFRVRNEWGTIGCLYSFVEQGNVLFYQSGLAQFTDDKLKPGLVTHALCMQECLERGLREYNFLHGDARYKRELSTTERELVWAVASRPNVRVRLIAGARHLNAMGRRLRHRFEDSQR